jgi:hypothetical protein
MNQGECDHPECLEHRKYDPTLECDGSGDDETHCMNCFWLFRKECLECGEYREATLCQNCDKQETLCIHFN